MSVGLRMILAKVIYGLTLQYINYYNSRMKLKNQRNGSTLYPGSTLADLNLSFNYLCQNTTAPTISMEHAPHTERLTLTAV